MPKTARIVSIEHFLNGLIQVWWYQVWSTDLDFTDLAHVYGFRQLLLNLAVSDGPWIVVVVDLKGLPFILCLVSKTTHFYYESTFTSLSFNAFSLSLCR